MTKRLSAYDVQDALEERISRGIYKSGEKLPPVRSLALELGTSQSTVSRAFQFMDRSGWIQIKDRQGVYVHSKLPKSASSDGEIYRALTSAAHKWKLSGYGTEDFTKAAEDVAQTVFAHKSRFVFTECNEFDLANLGDQLIHELDINLAERIIFHRLDVNKLQNDNSVLIVPYYHYAEVKDIVKDKVDLLPIHFGPSSDTLDKLLEIESGSQVLVIGLNRRSSARLGSIIKQYVDARVTQLHIEEKEKIMKFIREADVIVTLESIRAQLRSLAKSNKLIVIKFTLESGLDTIKMRLASAS